MVPQVPAVDVEKSTSAEEALAANIIWDSFAFRPVSHSVADKSAAGLLFRSWN